MGAWNVQTLLDRAGTTRPKRRMVLVNRELKRYKVDITELSETQFADEGSLKEESGQYTFFWKGKSQAEDSIHGVGFAIRSALLKSISVLPVWISEYLIKLHVPLCMSRHLTIISAYTPTLTSSDDNKQQFYEDLDQGTRSTPHSDKVVILRDLMTE